jgi:hypothetical protein
MGSGSGSSPSSARPLEQAVAQETRKLIREDLREAARLAPSRAGVVLSVVKTTTPVFALKTWWNSSDGWDVYKRTHRLHIDAGGAFAAQRKLAGVEQALQRYEARFGTDAGYWAARSKLRHLVRRVDKRAAFYKAQDEAAALHHEATRQAEILAREPVDVPPRAR